LNDPKIRLGIRLSHHADSGEDWVPAEPWAAKTGDLNLSACGYFSTATDIPLSRQFAFGGSGNDRGDVQLAGNMMPTSPAPRTVLRPVEHPDLSGVLTHFCDRDRPQPSIPLEIRGMTAQQRLESILWAGKLSGFVTFSGGVPALCFTEATTNGLSFLIGRRNYRPWALVVDRQAVYDAGGGPVWHARPEEYEFLRGICESGQVNNRLQSWLVRLGGTSDWLEEREWRIPLLPAPYEPALELSAIGLQALLVGDRDWSPARSGQLPQILAGIARWWRNPADGIIYQLPPLL
jgi:hypothetical protein